MVDVPTLTEGRRSRQLGKPSQSLSMDAAIQERSKKTRGGGALTYGIRRELGALHITALEQVRMGDLGRQGRLTCLRICMTELNDPRPRQGPEAEVVIDCWRSYPSGVWCLSMTGTDARPAAMWVFLLETTTGRPDDGGTRTCWRDGPSGVEEAW